MPGKERAISAVRSVESSSTTMISKVIPVWATSDPRHAPRQASSLRAGTMMETTGLVSVVIFQNRPLWRPLDFVQGRLYGTRGFLRLTPRHFRAGLSHSALRAGF